MLGHLTNTHAASGPNGISLLSQHLARLSIIEAAFHLSSGRSTHGPTALQLMVKQLIYTGLITLSSPESARLRLHWRTRHESVESTLHPGSQLCMSARLSSDDVAYYW